MNSAIPDWAQTCITDPSHSVERRPVTTQLRVLARAHWLGLVTFLLAVLMTIPSPLSEALVSTGLAPLTPAHLVLRVFQVALWARALVFVAYVLRDGRLLFSPSKLFLCERGLILQQGSTWHVLDAYWSIHHASDTAPLWLTHSPTGGRASFALPPVFEASNALLAERIMRRMAPVPTATAASPASSPKAASRSYDEALAEPPPLGVLREKHGLQFLLRGPVAATVFGLLFAYSLVATPLQHYAVWVAAAASTLWGGWLSLTWRAMRPRRGYAFVATTEHFLLRIRTGVIRVPMNEIVRISLVKRRLWSVLLGSQSMATLTIERQGDPPIRLDCAYMSSRPDAALAALEELHRRGVSP